MAKCELCLPADLSIVCSRTDASCGPGSFRVTVRGGQDELKAPTLGEGRFVQTSLSLLHFLHV